MNNWQLWMGPKFGGLKIIINCRTFDKEDEHSIRVQFECCGVVSASDWHNSRRFAEKNWVPDSCCRPSMLNASQEVKNCGTLQMDGLYYDQASRYTDDRP